MYQVSSTSAFVLLLTDQAIYDSPSAKRLWEKLDLEAARPFVEKALKFWAISEEINNRKFGIKKFCTDFLTAHPTSQVIFLGAGLDPKSLDVAESFPHSTIFDVDMDNMALKKDMTKSINGPQNITFCQANVGEAGQVSSVLESNSWDKERITLIVAEGISYYVPKKQFKNTLIALSNPKNGLILEYSLPDQSVLPIEIRPRVKDFFDCLQELLAWPTPLLRYSVEEMIKLASDLGAKTLTTLNQQQLEKERKGGKNETYTVPFSGVICVSYFNCI